MVSGSLKHHLCVLTFKKLWFNTVSHQSNFIQTPCNSACRYVGGKFFIVSVKACWFIQFTSITLFVKFTKFLHCSLSFNGPLHLTAPVSSDGTHFCLCTNAWCKVCPQHFYYPVQTFILVVIRSLHTLTSEVWDASFPIKKLVIFLL